MKGVTIYTTMTCPFCFKAKGLLNELNIPFNEISVDLKPKLREEMAAKAGRTSVPQIWFGDSHMGGCDDLYALHDAGSLSEALS
ncbi:MAG: glutaredoxin 3 [SAR86 cluster bacterium]|nr:glutaredoxin 3 [SAR86 cluster bacterium]